MSIAPANISAAATTNTAGSTLPCPSLNPVNVQNIILLELKNIY